MRRRSQESLFVREIHNIDDFLLSYNSIPSIELANVD